jgi:hypothetical protein
VGQETLGLQGYAGVNGRWRPGRRG